MTSSVRTVFGYALPLACIGGLLLAGQWLDAPARLLGATVGLLTAIKIGAWLVLRGRGASVSLSPVAFVLFWTVWPGIRPDRFGVEGATPSAPSGRRFVIGWLCALVGIGLVALSLVAPPYVGALPSTWLLLFGLLGMVHFGVGRLLPFGLRWAGLPVPALFDTPLLSRSVAGFWSRRWNKPFVEMNRLFLTTPLAGRYGRTAAALAGFLASGVLHELGISYAAGGGWGGPLLYFMLQAAFYGVERSVLPTDVRRRPVASRLWTACAVLLPLPLLFHVPFRTAFLLPLIEQGRAVLTSVSPRALLGAALWVGAAGHGLVLVASAQVPRELGWADDLQHLRPLNRKLMWTYGGFIVLTIVSFGGLTAGFHSAFVTGDTPLALGVAGVIALFWTARILTDALYFDHDDWPDGPQYVAGHALLTSLFVLLVAIYAGTVVYHLL